MGKIKPFALKPDEIIDTICNCNISYDLLFSIPRKRDELKGFKIFYDRTIHLPDEISSGFVSNDRRFLLFYGLSQVYSLFHELGWDEEQVYEAALLTLEKYFPNPHHSYK